MLAWHFLSGDKRLGYGDRRLVEVGQTLECEGELALCNNGLHGSARLIDALRYASGPIVCRVEIEGDVIEGKDKLCGRRRTVLWMLDATDILHEFAGEITDEELDSAWDAARDAARDAAYAAAWDAARAAVAAARDDARAVARAALDDAWAKQNERLTAMVMEAHETACEE